MYKRVFEFFIAWRYATSSRTRRELIQCRRRGGESIKLNNKAGLNKSILNVGWHINLILDTGAVLSDDGVLRTKSDSGRGGSRKTSRAKRSISSVLRSVKKKKLAA